MVSFLLFFCPSIYKIQHSVVRRCWSGVHSEHSAFPFHRHHLITDYPNTFRCFIHPIPLCHHYLSQPESFSITPIMCRCGHNLLLACRCGEEATDCHEIRPWIKSMSNHMYWVAASSGDDGDLKLGKWSSILNHVSNVHEGHSVEFP